MTDQYQTGLTEQNEALVQLQQGVTCYVQAGLRWCRFCVASTGSGGSWEKNMGWKKRAAEGQLNVIQCDLVQEIMKHGKF